MSVVLVKRTMSIFSCTALYTAYCAKIFDQLSDIDGFNVADVNPKELSSLLLFGDQNLGTVANRVILEATISFVKASARLN